jgi:hypothetical protein
MERLIDKEVDSFVEDIERAITKQIDAAARAVRNNGNIDAAIDSEPITEVYQDAWKNAALTITGKVYNAIDASRKEFTDEQYTSWEDNVDTYLAQKGGEQIRLIDNYTKEWVRATVTSATQTAAEMGLGTDDIAKILRGMWSGYTDQDGAVYPGISKNRALRIAQTEMNAAANYGAMEAATAAGMTRKFWIPARDDKVRPEHLEAGNAEPIGIQEKFNIGGYSMDRPSDPDGPAKHVINCRCQMGFLP